MHRVRSVNRHAIGDRLAGVKAIQQRDFRQVLFQRIRQFQEDVLALGGRMPGPDALLERAACGLHGKVNVPAVARGDLGDRLAGGRVDRGVGFGQCGVDEFAVNERLGAELQFRCGFLNVGVFEFPCASLLLVSFVFE